MLCKRNKRPINLSTGIHRSCEKVICGGWKKFTSSRGSVAWLPVASVCMQKLYTPTLQPRTVNPTPPISSSSSSAYPVEEQPSSSSSSYVYPIEPSSSSSSYAIEQPTSSSSSSNIPDQIGFCPINTESGIDVATESAEVLITENCGSSSSENGMSFLKAQPVKPNGFLSGFFKKFSWK